MDTAAAKTEYRLQHACIVASPSRRVSLEKARELASAALCTSPGEKPCGICTSCRKINNGIHPDVIFVTRETDSKGKVKSGITVDVIRRMNADAFIAPNEAEHKVYIIQEADTMNANAQNAALKLFEEPPAGAMFLLCVQNPDLLLPTVRSRCGEVYVSAPDEGAGEEAVNRALEYLSLAASGREDRLAVWCMKNEGMDGAALDLFLAGVKECAADMLSGRRESCGPDAVQLVKITGLIEKCEEYRRVNTGVKHIFGMLMVKTLN